ncbi:YaaA family protein [Rothia sp. P7208]|uniref:YaaA family protein n=1 Tax=Rothia sp. P7208 TaxID=3402660 RepID=UPI003ACBBB41
MLILFPPSEGKTAQNTDRTVDLADLSFPELTQSREELMQQLQIVSDSEDALAQLKVGASLAQEVERNTRLWREPAAQASEVYSGVLFEAFNFSSLDEQAQERAINSVVIISALWGAVRFSDVIPAYRLSMGVKLGEIGDLAKYWKGELPTVLNRHYDGELVIDCRSAAYVKAYPTPVERTLSVRVEKVLEGDERKVVSHMAKHYRGELGRYLVQKGLTEINVLDELINELSKDWEIEFSPATAKSAGILTLVVR